MASVGLPFLAMFQKSARMLPASLDPDGCALCGLGCAYCGLYRAWNWLCFVWTWLCFVCTWLCLEMVVLCVDLVVLGLGCALCALGCAWTWLCFVWTWLCLELVMLCVDLVSLRGFCVGATRLKVRRSMGTRSSLAGTQRHADAPFLVVQVAKARSKAWLQVFHFVR